MTTVSAGTTSNLTRFSELLRIAAARRDLANSTQGNVANEIYHMALLAITERTKPRLLEAEFINFLTPSVKAKLKTAVNTLSPVRLSNNRAILYHPESRNVAAHVIKALYCLHPFLKKGAVSISTDNVRISLETFLPREGIDPEFINTVQTWNSRFKRLAISVQYCGLPEVLVLRISDISNAVFAQFENTIGEIQSAVNVANGATISLRGGYQFMPYDDNYLSDINTLFDFLKTYARYVPCQPATTTS